jgi:hypothetical protein
MSPTEIATRIAALEAALADRSRPTMPGSRVFMTAELAMLRRKLAA